jgi:hypothetical protein
VKIRKVNTYVAGVTHHNADGTSRQQAIRGLKIDDQLQLVRDVGNAYSSCAIRVVTAGGKQIGFIPEDVASFMLAESIDAGFPAIARIGKFLPPNDRFPDTIGVIVDVQYTDVSPPPPPTAAQLATAEQAEFKQLAEEYFAYLQAALLDGVITREEEDDARVFGSALPEGIRRAVHAKLLMDVVKKNTKKGAITDAALPRIQMVRDFVARLGWAP